MKPLKGTLIVKRDRDIQEVLIKYIREQSQYLNMTTPQKPIEGTYIPKADKGCTTWGIKNLKIYKDKKEGSIIEAGNEAMGIATKLYTLMKTIGPFKIHMDFRKGDKK